METLISLEFTVDEQGDEWQATIPPHRRDIELEADLVEEVARIWGYDKTRPLPLWRHDGGGQGSMMQLEDDLRVQLVGFDRMKPLPLIYSWGQQ